MSTFYEISVGYNSAHHERNVWEQLKIVVDAIQENPSRIVDEVLRLEPDANFVLIEEVASYYRKPVIDLTIKIVEDSEDSDNMISQHASGCNPGRDAKESCRRAVCRLVLEEMHKCKMEVNIIVG